MLLNGVLLFLHFAPAQGILLYKLPFNLYFQGFMQDAITEAEVISLSGYSREQLRSLRLGSKQVKGGKEYVSAPVITQGVDWQLYGRSVLYAPHVLEFLKERRAQAKVRL